MTMIIDGNRKYDEKAWTWACSTLAEEIQSALIWHKVHVHLKKRCSCINLLLMIENKTTVHFPCHYDHQPKDAYMYVDIHECIKLLKNVTWIFLELLNYS